MTLLKSNSSNISIAKSIENSTSEYEPGDATWILTSAFIIFTMQSGFGLLESGMVSRKNETSIMVKNAVDVIYGGLAYWLFGFGFSFGESEYSNSFCGIGYFATQSSDADKLGWIHAKFFFQLSFATTACTIVSGAMAERTNLRAYTIFAFVSVLTYCFPAHWVWDVNTGWLHKLGYVDIAGASVVHVVGGVNGLLATVMLKPRHRRFDEEGRPRQTEISGPTNILLGTFMLWWGWLGFNCGSTFGVSGGKWKFASRSAVTTLNSSTGGAVAAMMFSYITEKNVLTIPIFVTGIISGLVSITGVCAVCRPGEAFIIGFIGSLLACCGIRLLEKLRIDDPVGCVPTHLFAGAWSIISVALFAEKDSLEAFSKHSGLFKGGEWRFLGIQVLGLASIASLAGIVGFIELYLVNKTVGLRVSLMEEIIGADQVEHGIADAANLAEKLSRCDAYSAAGVKVRLARTRRRVFAVKEPRYRGTLIFTSRRTSRRNREEERDQRSGGITVRNNLRSDRSIGRRENATLETTEMTEISIGENMDNPYTNCEGLAKMTGESTDSLEIADITLTIDDQDAMIGNGTPASASLRDGIQNRFDKMRFLSPVVVNEPDKHAVLCYNGGHNDEIDRTYGDLSKETHAESSLARSNEGKAEDDIVDTDIIWTVGVESHTEQITRL